MATSTQSDDPKLIKAKARQAGVLYLLLAIVAPFNHIYVPNALFVSGDATATARNIIDSELTYRFGIFSGLVGSVIFLFLVLSLYNLLKDVDRKQARLMVTLVVVAVAIGSVNLLIQIAPLIFLGGADFLSAFSKAELDALALAFLKLRNGGTYVAMIFWGLWLLPFGVLVIRSGFFPRLLGILLIVGGIAYVVLSFTGIVLPAYHQTVSQIGLPFYAVGELAMIVWLLVVGAKVQEAEI